MSYSPIRVQDYVRFAQGYYLSGDAAKATFWLQAAAMHREFGIIVPMDGLTMPEFERLAEEFKGLAAETAANKRVRLLENKLDEIIETLKQRELDSRARAAGVKEALASPLVGWKHPDEKADAVAALTEHNAEAGAYLDALQIVKGEK